ncbi:MAG: hypothetical protein LW834_06815 [Cyanobium sp. 49614_E6]|jgi:hypothetical protein|nr:hypothetical protein [Cyanobium sp. 49614_E6]
MTTPTFRAAMTSDDIPLGPFSEDDLRQQWNARADEFNQWDSLDTSEQLAWAQARAAAAVALKAEPEGEGPILQWTENMPPSEGCRYDHCTAETPFGRFLISWKGWKQFHSPTVDETPWGDWFGAFNSVDDAKAACQQGMNERLSRWGRPTTPPPLPPNFIDPDHTGQDRELLEVFYRACNAEGGTADEIHLRGIKAVLAACSAAPPAPQAGEGEA